MNKLFFNPIWSISLMLFLTLTTLHLESDFLMSIHIELISLVFITAGIIFYVRRNNINIVSSENFFPLGICILLGISPLISSYLNSDFMNIINDDEYKSLIKTLFITPLIYLYLKYSSNAEKNTIKNIYVILICILGFYFFYRYLILNEVREYDLRPRLKIKHGDPNFLCTIFSMGVPLSIKIAYDYFKSFKKILGSIFITIGLFLIVCSFATQSRMGILALFFGLLYLIIKKTWKYSKTSISAVLSFSLVLFTFILLSGSLERFQNINDKSNSDRILTFQNGLTIISEFPIFGVGMHNAKNSFYKNTHYPNFQSEFNQLDIHNTFLKIFAELGVLGLALFLTLIYFCWPRNNSNNDNLYFLKSSYIIVIISCLTIGITYKDFLYFHLFILAGLSFEENHSNFKTIN